MEMEMDWLGGNIWMKAAGMGEREGWLVLMCPW